MTQLSSAPAASDTHVAPVLSLSGRARMNRPPRRVAGSAVLILLVLWTANAIAQSGQRSAADAGAQDAQIEQGVDAGPGAAVTPHSWRRQQIEQLRRLIDETEKTIARLAALAAEVVVPRPPIPLLPREMLTDPQATMQQTALLQRELQQMEQGDLEQAARTEMMLAELSKASQTLARWRKRKRRGRRIPARVLREGLVAEQRAELLRAERTLRRARRDLHKAVIAYLLRSQPARRQAHALQLERKEQERQTKAENERAKKLAAAERVSADRAKRAALDAQRRAQSEAERLLAGATAHLEGIRGEQAAFHQTTVAEKGRLAKLRSQLERFRGDIARRVESLSKTWPATAPQFDELYDRVVRRLAPLRSAARKDLLSLIRGSAVAPEPKPLDRRLRQLDEVYRAQTERLVAFEEKLRKNSAALTTKRRTLTNNRLALLQREITWLNDHRTQLLTRVTENKRDSLTGLTRETAAQAGREVAQAAFDATFWLYHRLQQVDKIPRLIVDIFTVGSLLWKTLKLLALFFLLRFLLRHWNRWLQLAVRKVSRAVTLGRSAPMMAKLTDTLRHTGPALLVLLTGTAVYYMLGGEEAAAEFRFAYVVFFWVAAYRILLRLVESAAKYAGMEHALRRSSGEENLSEEEELEGPPQPAELRPSETPPLARRSTLETVTQLFPSALLVRSFRATTRYLLVVVLILELTSLAVGRGTIYWLTAGFSWWAALPFIVYYLRLWRPHIARAYRRIGTEDSQSTLRRLVRQSEDKFYGVLVIAAAFAVVTANRLATFARRYLSSRDATKRLLALLFRRRVAKRALELGRVVAERQTLAPAIVDQFPTGPLDPGDRPVQPPQMQQLQEAFSRWKEAQHDGSLALVGHSGMGRSTIVRLLEPAISAPVLRADVRTKIIRPAKVVSWIAEVFGFNPRPSSEKELIRMIREDTRPVVAIDNCHNLFLRQVNGFKGWETFIRVVSATCDNVFWLLTFNRIAWNYLHNMSGRVLYFRRVLDIPAWPERMIRGLLLSRMRRARFRVSFSDLVMTQLENVDFSEQLGRTSEGYFRMMWDFTEGNPRLAGQFWLDSLVPVEAERSVRVHLFAEPNIGELERLPDKMGFVLTAIVEHESLTVEQVARTTNLSLDFCAFAVKQFLEKKYLVVQQGTDRFRVSMRWQRPVIRFLRRKHLLHD